MHRPPLHILPVHGVHMVLQERGVTGHRQADGDKDTTGIAISFGHCCATPSGESDDVYAVLITYSDWHEALWALPVFNKGVATHEMEGCAGDICQAGCCIERITLKSDREPSIGALKQRLLLLAGKARHLLLRLL